MLKKTSSKIILFYSLLIIVITLFQLFYFSRIIYNNQLDLIQRDEADKAIYIAHWLERSNVTPDDKNLIQKEIDTIANIINTRITAITLDGNVIADTAFNSREMENHFYRQEIQEALTKGTGKSIRFSSTLNSKQLYYALRSEKLIIRLAKPLNEIEYSISSVRKTIMFSGFLALLVGIIINIILSKILANPIHNTITFAQKFASGDLTSRIHDYKNDEVGLLQRNLNQLADNLEDKINILVSEQNKLAAIIQNIADGLAVIDNNNKIVLSNQAFNRIWSIGLAAGRNYFEIIRSSELNSIISKAFQTSEILNMEMEIGNNRFFDVNISSIFFDGSINGMLVVMHDISERKHIEKMKTDLVGNLSHELKTPLAILRGYLETIDDNLNEQELCHGFIGKSLLNVDRQNALINDMLKLNKFETVNRFEKEEINLFEIVSNCLEILQPKIENKRIKLSIDEIDFPTSVTANRTLAEEIFFNLLDNAVNYNITGGNINVSIRNADKSICIDIADSGEGIPSDELGKIFERFYRIDKGRARNSGGTGLGLAIVKHASNVLGWKIEVISNSSGSIFTIIVPL